MSVLAIGALAGHATSQASSISNTALAQHKHGVHMAKHSSTFATPASNALGNNTTKTAGLSKDFLSAMNGVKAG